MTTELSLRDVEEFLEQSIGYHFSKPSLLREALTHTSYHNENPGLSYSHSERLEFLGDAVLDLAISHSVFSDLPGQPEGELTRIRAEVVNEKSLAGIARTLDLGACLQLGKGEVKTGGRQKDSLLADAFEALLGAVYLDGGFEVACEVIERLFSSPIKESAQRKLTVDHKTRLQEKLQAQYGRTPSYIMTQVDGPVHERIYCAEVRFEGKRIGSGEGRSKKAAQQAAAAEALAAFDE